MLETIVILTTYIADVFSTLGSIASVITLLMMRSIKNKLLFRSRLDDHISSLNAHSVKITTYLNDYLENQFSIETEFELANVTLKSLEKGANKDLSLYLSTIRDSIKDYSCNENLRNEKMAKKINSKLNVIVEELLHAKQELLIEG